MITLGLTGSIAMGKSTVAGLFRDEGIAVHDADAAVHRLMQPDGRAFAEIAAAFPDVIIDGAIDRKSLGSVEPSRGAGRPSELARPRRDRALKPFCAG